jgi:carbonic anhydrase
MELIYRYDPFQPVVVRRPGNSQEAIDTLVDGNRRLVNMVERMQRAALEGDVAPPEVVSLDLVSMGLPFMPGVTLDQAPFALVLGCSDARVPIESIFDQSFNDLFVIRIAGNVLGTECIGSVDYAVRNFGRSLQAIVVVGHTGCGAVTAAVDTYLSPTAFTNIALTHPLRTLVDRIMIAVRAAANAFDRCFGHDFHGHAEYRGALIQASVYLNAAIAAHDLQREARSAMAEQVKAYYGVCDIGTMLVHDLPPTEPAGGPLLSPAPKDAPSFIALADQVVRLVVARLDGVQGRL